METNINWFNYSENDSDINNVLTFLGDLPHNFNEFLDSKNSNFKVQLLKYENFGINVNLFNSALKEAFNEFEFRFLNLNRRLKLDEISGINYRTHRFIRDLRKNGLYGESLRLKAYVLNMLWSEVLEKANEFAQGIINFANNEIVKPLRKFLTYLNSIFGSFLQVFPGLESVKEIKEIMEAFLGIADD